MKLFSTKKPIALFMLCFILLLSLITTTTLAWFTMNTVVQITSPSDDNLAVQINSGDLEISVSYQLHDTEHYGEFTEYSGFVREMDLNVSSPQYIDLTGNGKSLWFPAYINDNDLPEYTDGASWSNVTENVAYCITLKFKFRTSQTMDVYLNNSSYVSEIENIFGSDIIRSSSMGEFSCDGIAGATRVAFLETTSSAGGDEVLKAVWIPNDKYELSFIDEGSSAVFSTDGNREDYYCYWNKVAGAMTRTVYAANTPNTATFCNGEVIVGNDSLASSEQAIVNFGAPLLSFTANGQMQEKYLTVRIWFEGTDREANTALDGGKVKYKLGFSGINKSEVTAEEQSRVNGIVFYNRDIRWGDGTSCAPINGVAQILYSYDGIDWFTYGGWSDLHPLEQRVAYVRTIETSEKKASAIKQINISY